MRQKKLKNFNNCNRLVRVCRNSYKNLETKKTIPKSFCEKETVFVGTTTFIKIAE
ncbi:hypothetical protein LEP1GSC041_3172 [Leptospira noguchii str. 2006001870]|nr:hypothetical protein LEP1GSC041_3172 [Leptospira noguchii str. 2006001870]